MRVKPLAPLAVLAVLAACMSPVTYTRAQSPDLFQALDTRPDGYVGVVRSTGATYTIVSTRANSSRLCRVVTLKAPGDFQTESFCKSKGGEWR